MQDIDTRLGCSASVRLGLGTQRHGHVNGLLHARPRRCSCDAVLWAVATRRWHSRTQTHSPPLATRRASCAQPASVPPAPLRGHRAYCTRATARPQRQTTSRMPRRTAQCLRWRTCQFAEPPRLRVLLRRFLSGRVLCTFEDVLCNFTTSSSIPVLAMHSVKRSTKRESAIFFRRDGLFVYSNGNNEGI